MSGLEQWRTSTLELSMPTANQSPVGQKPRQKICELKLDTRDKLAGDLESKESVHDFKEESLSESVKEFIAL